MTIPETTVHNQESYLRSLDIVLKTFEGNILMLYGQEMSRDQSLIS